MRKIVIITCYAIFAISIFVVLIFFITRKGNTTPEYEYVEAVRSSIIQEVDVTGRVKSIDEVDLAFERSGRVVEVNTEVGATTTADTILIKLEQATFAAKLAQARAGLANELAVLKQHKAALSREEIELDEFKRGTRHEELLIAETTVMNAEQALKDSEAQFIITESKADVDLANIYDDVTNVLDDVFAKADNAINYQIDELFNNDSSSNPSLTFSTLNTSDKIGSESMRVQAGRELSGLKDIVGSFSIDDYLFLDQLLLNAESNLVYIRQFLTEIVGAVDGATSLTQIQINAYKSNIDTGRTNINTALTSISTLEQNISAQRSTNESNIIAAKGALNDAQNTLNSANRNLQFKQAGTTQGKIKIQEAQIELSEANVSAQTAQVMKAQANVSSALAELATTELRAPFGGTITSINAQVGEIVSGSFAVVSLIVEDELEIEALIPEADVIKVSVGNIARLTLDAYDEDVVFEAVVTNIDPAAELNEGVASYRTTLVFTEKKNLVRAGMTTDMDIVTAERDDVIVIPQRAVIFRNDKKIVRILEADNELIEVEVVTGVSGNRGLIEITSGVHEGDKVVTSIKKDNK